MKPIPDAAGPRRLAAAAVLVAAATLTASLAPHAVSTTGAVFTSTGTATTTLSTREACTTPTGTPATPYADYLAKLDAANAPSFWWRFPTDPSATTVADASSAGATGVVSGTDPQAGIAFTADGLVECDTSGGLAQLAAPAGAGFVVLPEERALPAELTVAVWVRAEAGVAGGLVTFADADDESVSQAYAQLALEPDSRLAMTLDDPDAGEVVTARTSRLDEVTGSEPHLVVATVTAHAGTRTVTLYLDGVTAGVASGAAPVTGAGYWRTGGGAAPAAPAVLDELAVWEGRALPATEVAALAGADHW